MIYTEEFEVNGKLLRKTWSDEYTLIQLPTGAEYDEAVDTLPTQFTYIESENEKPKEPEEAQR
jgi:hypothetical protein